MPTSALTSSSRRRRWWKGSPNKKLMKLMQIVIRLIAPTGPHAWSVWRKWSRRFSSTAHTSFALNVSPNTAHNVQFAELQLRLSRSRAKSTVEFSPSRQQKYRSSKNNVCLRRTYKTFTSNHSKASINASLKHSSPAFKKCPTFFDSLTEKEMKIDFNSYLMLFVKIL